MAIIKPLSSMIVGEEGVIIRIDSRIEYKLMTVGIEVGTHVLVVAKVPGSISIQVANKIFVIPEAEASMILIKVWTEEPIQPWVRKPYQPFYPEIWRSCWPFPPFKFY